MKQSTYHLGRLITYLTLGLLTGLIGQRIDTIGNMAGIQNSAALITGVILITSGLFGLLKLKATRFVDALYRPFRRLQKSVLPNPSRPVIYPLVLGLFSTFLPCGWLYTYVAVAASQGSVLMSVAVMFFFWLGTVPILSAIGASSRLILSPLTRFVPAISSLILLIAGFHSLYSHISMHEHHSMHQHSCH